MFPRANTSSAARWVLLLGWGAAAALFGGMFLDFGDPGATARARLEKEAQSEGSLVRTKWRERLSSEDWLAESIAPQNMSLDGFPAISQPLAGPADEKTEIRLLAARAAAANGATTQVQEHLVEVMQSGSPKVGEALLMWVRYLRKEDGEVAAATYLAHAAQAPWNAAIEGTSGRLLALLSVGADLSVEDRSLAIATLVSAIKAGSVALPVPSDSAQATAEGFEFTLDPWWSALRSTAEARLGHQGVDWRVVFHEPARRAAALARLDPERVEGTWSLKFIDPDIWLASLLQGTRLKVALHTSSALAATVESLSLGEGGLRAVAFSPSEGLLPVADAGLLKGTDVALSIQHSDPDTFVRRERRRLAFLRGGLGVLGLLVLITTAIAARLIARARALNSLRSTFVATVSHDLRTPLASISLMAENLASGYAKGSEERYVDSIRREVARLGRMVDGLLDFGRIERDLLPNVTRCEVDVDGWLDQFEARERARCAAAGCALAVERGGPLGKAHLDVGALERALSNLVDNALKHAHTDAIRLRTQIEGGGILAFQVEDAGQGLPCGTVHEHLFQPFRRKGEAGGTGLGLTIVRAIAEAHGGSASLAAGQDGRGVCATLRIGTTEDSAA